MKRKEIQQMAKKIAKLEAIRETSNNKKEIYRAEQEITKLMTSFVEHGGQIDDLEEAIMDIEKNS